MGWSPPDSLASRKVLLLPGTGSEQLGGKWCASRKHWEEVTMTQISSQYGVRLDTLCRCSSSTCERAVFRPNHRHSIAVYLSDTNRGAIMFHRVQRYPRVKGASFFLGSSVWFGAKRFPKLKFCTSVCLTSAPPKDVVLSDTCQLLCDDCFLHIHTWADRQRGHLQPFASVRATELK